MNCLIKWFAVSSSFLVGIYGTNLWGSTELIFVALPSKIVSVDVSTGLITNTIPITSVSPVMAISANGKVGTYIEENPGDAYIFDPFSSAPPIRIFDGVNPFFGTSPSVPLDGSIVYMVGKNVPSLYSIDPKTYQATIQSLSGEPDAQAANNDRFLCMSFTSIANEDGLNILDLNSGTVTAVENTDSTELEDNFSFYIAPDSKVLYVIGYQGTGVIYVVDPITAKVRYTFTAPLDLNRICTNLDGTIVAGIDEMNKDIWVLSPTQEFPPVYVPGPFNPVRYGILGSLALDYLGKKLYATSSTQLFTIDTATGVATVLHDFGSENINSIAYYTDQPIYPLQSTGTTRIAYDAYQKEYFNFLSWSLTDPPQSYSIYRNGIEIATLSGQANHYEDHNLSSNTSYLYEIKALSRAGIPVTTSSITITTQG